MKIDEILKEFDTLEVPYTVREETFFIIREFLKQSLEKYARSEVVRELEEHIKWLQEEGLEESWVIEQLAIRIEELKGEKDD